MKHQRPSTLVAVLPCRLESPFESGVGVNVPASLHGTVMHLACTSQSTAAMPVGQWPRGLQKPNSGVRNAKRSVDRQPFAVDASLGTGPTSASLTSRRYRAPLVWERLADAAFQCYRGARKRSRSEQARYALFALGLSHLDPAWP